MSTAASAHATGSERVGTGHYWVAVLVRALVTLVAGFFVALDPDRSTGVGLAAFGGFGVVEGLVVVWCAFGVRDGVARWIFVAQGLLGVVMGVAALVLDGAGLGVFLYGVSVWALLTGFAELYSGWRGRGREAGARDWMVVGGLTVVLAVVFVLIPPDATVATGLFGAYAVIVGIYLGIGAFILRLRSAPADDAAHADAVHTDENATEKRA